MACVLQIGAGGVGGVVAHKMAMNRESFTRIILASRTLDKCRAIADSIREKGLGEIEIDSVDADSVESVVALIEKYRPKLVVNVALPYQDLSIMEACLRTKTHYLDTANYEHPDSAHFEYKEQWAYDTRYKQAGIFALLGSGFDPGVTNVFCAYAQKHYFDEIHSIDILDCNAGDHGYAFATNFNPEINLREVSSKARYWVKDGHSACTAISAESAKIAQSLTSSKLNRDFLDNPQTSSTILECQDSSNMESQKVGSNTESNSLVSQADLALNPDLKQDTIYRKFEREEKHFTLDSNTQDLKVESYFNGQWRDIAPLALMKEWDYPEVGVKNSYLLYHEELESLIRNIKGLRKIRFFMTFGESYLTHMKCLENIGFLRIDEVAHKGGKIVPIEVLKTLLPDPASLASRTKGQTHIGCYMKGVKDGKERTIYIYNICDHEACYKEVNAQGVSYTTGVPAMIGAKLICEDKWGLNQPKTPNNADNSDMPKGGEYQGIDNAIEIGDTNPSGNLSAKDIEKLRYEAGTVGCFAFCEGEHFDFKIGEDTFTFKVKKWQYNKWKHTEKHYIELHSQKYGFMFECDLGNFDAKLDEWLNQFFSNATQGAGVWNMEQNDPDPFMCELNKQGLPYIVCEIESNGNLKVLEDGRG